ncbi:AAA family ATPase [Oryzomonas japonica]|uniref:AAA family ATPase n=2 Tax=Oryzomonas japonica TaxID=2603858 RepID=A0A7J4ZRM6_9BACT|nr:AAA family ATPase [Oryzomonas japonica]
MERHATYVFKRDTEGVWRCVVDNSYGTELIRPESAPVLYLVCGKIGAGKSTLAHRLAANAKTILVSEDDWLSQIYADEINNLSDYVRCTGRFRKALAGHIAALLQAGLSVVLDFPANTPTSRQWAKALFEKADVAHELHYLDAPDETCKARLHERNAASSHPFMVSDNEFDEITHYFVPPSPDEGFNVIRHT